MNEVFPGSQSRPEYWDYDNLRWDYMDALESKEKVRLAIDLKYNMSPVGERINKVSQCMAFKSMVLEFRKIFTMDGMVSVSAELIKMANDLKEVYATVIGILYQDGKVPVRDKSADNHNKADDTRFTSMILPWGPWIICTENEFMVFKQRQQRLRWSRLVNQATQRGDQNSNNSSNSNNKEENDEDEEEAKAGDEATGREGRGRGRYGDPRNKARNQRDDRSRSRDKGRKKRRSNDARVAFNIDNIDSIPDELSPSAVQFYTLLRGL